MFSQNDWERRRDSNLGLDKRTYWDAQKQKVLFSSPVQGSQGKVSPYHSTVELVESGIQKGVLQTFLK